MRRTARRALARYVRAAVRQLEAEPEDALLAGKAVFPSPESFRECLNREKLAPLPWHVPVALDDVPEEGQHFDLAADAETRAAVAQMAGLRDLAAPARRVSM